MSEAARYLDGFLAAVRPGNAQVAADTLPVVTGSEFPSPPGPVAEAILSTEEGIKRRLHPLDSFPRLLECAEMNRPPEPDDCFRFQWFGLFYQAPRQDAFLLRLRLPGGRLEAFQLLGLADIVQECAGGQVLLNAQGGLDLPGVPVRMAAEILRRIEGIGLSARQTGGDCVQSIRGGEDEGLLGSGARLELIYPLVRGLEQALAYSRHLADLPRGCEIVFRRANEPLAADHDGPLDTLVLQATASAADGSSPDHEASFQLIMPGDEEGGWLLPDSRVVTGCLKLLDAWAGGADRTQRQNASWNAYRRTLPRERISSLLGDAEWQPAPRPVKIGPRAPKMPMPSGCLVPGGRLLSAQLRQIEKTMHEQSLLGVRLVRGNLHLAPGTDAQASESISRALKTR